MALSSRLPEARSGQARDSRPPACRQPAAPEPAAPEPAAGCPPARTPRASAAGPAACQPAARRPGSPDPMLSPPAPSTPTLSAPEPGLPEPGLPEPGLPEPGLPEPGLPEPGLPEPGLPEPGVPEPSAPQPPGPPWPTVPRPAPGALLPRSPAENETVPSWAAVLATTLRLWAQRHLPFRSPHGQNGRQGQFLAAAAVIVYIVVAVIAVLTASVLTHSAGGRAGRPAGSASGGSAAAVAASRAQAAGWIAAQASPAAIVACDPVMCSAIQARGFPPGNLDPIGPASNDPLGSTIVVATAAIRGQFGSRLSQVYAPLIIARFGSGAARIDVRATAVGGTAAYLGALRADVTSRAQTGSQLLHNSRLSAAKPARRELAAGQVDSRLLMTLAALTATNNVEVRGFGDSGPRASRGVPLRSAELAVIGTGASGRGYRHWLLAFLGQQHAPYKAASVRIRRLAGSTAAEVEFSAPSPLGLLVNSP